MLIVEVNYLMVTWKTVDRMLMSMWAEFCEVSFKSWILKRRKKKLQFVYKIERM